MSGGKPPFQGRQHDNLYKCDLSTMRGCRNKRPGGTAGTPSPLLREAANAQAIKLVHKRNARARKLSWCAGRIGSGHHALSVQKNAEGKGAPFGGVFAPVLCVCFRPLSLSNVWTERRLTLPFYKSLPRRSRLAFALSAHEIYRKITSPQRVPSVRVGSPRNREGCPHHTCRLVGRLL